MKTQFDDMTEQPARRRGVFFKEQNFHITNTGQSCKNDESRVFAKETREMDSALPLHLLVGVDL